MKLQSLLTFETRRYFKSFVIYTIVWVLLIAFFMTFFPSIKANADQLVQLYKNFPKDLMSALGKDPSQITNIYGYFGSSIMLYLMLSGCIFTIFIAGGSLPGEIANKNILFLLSKPLSRIQIYVCKVLALIINLLVSNAILLICSIISIKLFTHEDISNLGFFVIAYVFLFILQLFFASLTYLIGLAWENGRAVALASFAVFIFYIIKVASNLSDQTKDLRLLTVNYYINIDGLTSSSSFQWENLVVVILTIVLLVTSAYIFVKKDINA